MRRQRPQGLTEATAFRTNHGWRWRLAACLAVPLTSERPQPDNLLLPRALSLGAVDHAWTDLGPTPAIQCQIEESDAGPGAADPRSSAASRTTPCQPSRSAAAPPPEYRRPGPGPVPTRPQTGRPFLCLGPPRGKRADQNSLSMVARTMTVSVGKTPAPPAQYDLQTGCGCAQHGSTQRHCGPSHLRRPDVRSATAEPKPGAGGLRRSGLGWRERSRSSSNADRV